MAGPAGMTSDLLLESVRTFSRRIAWSTVEDPRLRSAEAPRCSVHLAGAVCATASPRSMRLWYRSSGRCPLISRRRKVEWRRCAQFLDEIAERV